jgi:TonB family protein
MASAAVPNLIAWTGQVTVVVAAAALVARVLHVDAAGARYAWWRVVLLVCLALPALQPWQPSEVISETPQSISAGGNSTSPSAMRVETATSPSPLASPGSPAGRDAIAIALALGAALRLGWLALGLVRLRRLRRLGESTGTCDWDDLRTVMQVDAEVRWIDAVRQPVTFGLLRPVVLLPSSLAAVPADVRRAVVAHELWHVQRRDWAWVIVEETLRSVLWFNPAMWWLISRIQGCREEVVDELTVLITNGRRSYLEALLAFADEPTTFPATPFARRRQLLTRMLLVSKEAAMSSRRIIGSCAGMLAGLLIAGSYAAIAFPLTAAAPSSRQAPPRDPRPNEPRPATTRETSIQAAVTAGTAEPSAWLELAKLQEQRGATTMAESTLIAMRTAFPGRTGSYHALAALYGRMGQFDQGIGVLEDAIALDPSDPNGYQILVTFLTQKSSDVRLSIPERLVYVRQGVATADRALAVKPEFAEAMIYKSLLLRTQANLETDVSTQQQLLREADTVRNRALALRLSSAPQAQSTTGRTGNTMPPPPPPPPPPPAPAGLAPGPGADAGVRPLRVGGDIHPPTKLKDVPAVYPAAAREAGVQGVVILEVVIDEMGNVSTAGVLRSVELLDQAALEAVRQWQFTPTLLNGLPVPVVMTVTINFTLQ